MENNGLIAATFVIYLVLMLLLGIIAYQRTHNLSDYILGGRRLGSVVTALSAGASDMSGWLLLGLPGYAYLTGLEAGWIALGLLAGTYLNWRLVAKPLRRRTHDVGDALTLPAYFELRFNDKSRLLRVIAAFFILLFFTFYTSSGLVAGGKLFNAVFGFPYHWAVAMGVLAIIIYTFMGGFLAVSWTDVIQSLLMLFALVIVPLLAISYAGGWNTNMELVAQHNPALLDSFSDKTGKPLGLIAILSLLGWGLGYFGQPHILARFMAIQDSGHLVKARRIAMTWVTLTLLGALCVGLAGIGIMRPPLSDIDSEKIFILLVELLFHPLVAGVCLAAVLAAIMSTADSQLLVASSALTEDFYKSLLRKQASQNELVWTGRIAVVVIAAIAFALALDPDSKVLDLVAYAWAGFGAAFGPTIILSLYWQRMTRNGALAGIITGGLTVIIWKQVSGGIFNLYEIIPGFILSCIAIFFVSSLERNPGKKSYSYTP